MLLLIFYIENPQKNFLLKSLPKISTQLSEIQNFQNNHRWSNNNEDDFRVHKNLKFE